MANRSSGLVNTSVIGFPISKDRVTCSGATTTASWIADPMQMLMTSPIRSCRANQKEAKRSATVPSSADTLQVVPPCIAHRHRIVPRGDRGRLLAGRFGRQPGDGRAHLVPHQLGDRVDVDQVRHVADEIDERADAEREVRHERAVGLRPHAAQHHQALGERAEEDAERRLIAAVAGEVAQQRGTHLAGGERQGGNGD
jgi:hypothetical protein